MFLTRKNFIAGGMSILLSTCALAGVAFAAEETPEKGGKIHLVVHPEPPLLMQGLSQNAPTNIVAGSIYESLLRYSQSLDPQPSLAREWKVSDDGLEYTFFLQENVVWHDGEPFNADDVVFSLDDFLREVHPRWRPIADNQIERIEKLDDFTVKITLQSPFGPLLLAMEVSSAPIVPEHIYKDTDYRLNPANNMPIGTGPFKFSEWVKGSYIRLVKNENYWLEDRPYLDEVYWHIIPDSAARAVAFEAGKVDVLTGGSVDIFDIERLQKVANTCVTTEGWEMFAPHSWLNVNTRNGVLGNKQFRQGLLYAIDREFGRDVVWGGLGKVPTGPISSKTRFYSPDVMQYEFNPEKARELIAASGYNGEEVRLLIMPYGEVWVRWAEAIRQNLIDVGVNVRIDTTDVPGFTQRLSNWDFDLAFTYLLQNGDPAIGVARSYVSTNIVKGNPFANVGGYTNPEVDRLFSEASATSNDDVRQEKYSEVQRILAEEVPVLWLLELDFPMVMKCEIKNIVSTGIGVNDGLRDAWLKQ